MERGVTKKPRIPKFKTETDEADWWASAQGRRFLSAQAAPVSGGGSRLVTNLVRAKSVQIALRLPSQDLIKAKEIAERRGIGYQTLLKMLVHSGLRRAESGLGE